MQCVAGLVLDACEVPRAVFVGSVVWDANAIAGLCGGVHHRSGMRGAVGALGQVGEVRINLIEADETAEAVDMLSPLSQDAQHEASAKMDGSC